jgi:transcription factor SFP1
MPGAASPIDIATSRQNSSSPRTQQSNLTSQLLQPNNDHRMMAAPEEIPTRTRQESIMLSGTPFGARQIPLGSQRRESYQMSGSLANGMSWGGISMGSFIRDE